LRQQKRVSDVDMSNDEVTNNGYESQSLDRHVALTSIPTLDVASLMVTTDDADSMPNLQTSHKKDTSLLSSDLNPGTFNHGEHIFAPSDLAEIWDGCINDDLFRDDAMGNLDLDNSMFLSPRQSASAAASMPVDQAIDETPTCNNTLHQFLEGYVPSTTSSIAQSTDNPMISLDVLQSSPSTVRSTSLPFISSTDTQAGRHMNQDDLILQTPTS
jgi:hypothetical protein